MCLEPNKVFTIGFKENGKQDIKFANSKATCIYQEKPHSDWKVGYDDLAYHFSHSFDVRKDYVQVPCGKCVECQRDRAREWSTRIALDVKSYNSEDNFYFITLTYNDDNIPYTESGYPTLVIEDYQLFMKRFRKFQKDAFGKDGVRFYIAGEYGPKTLRPHYHLLVWNCVIPDLELFRISPTGNHLFTSKSIFELWYMFEDPDDKTSKKLSLGHHLIGKGSLATAMYTAKYVSKGFDDTIKQYCKKTGAFAPFSRMSLRPALGLDYLNSLSDTDKCQMIERGSIILNTDNGGYSNAVPRYFKRKIADTFPDEVARVSSRNKAVYESKENLLVSMLDMPLDQFRETRKELANESIRAGNAFVRNQI